MKEIHTLEVVDRMLGRGMPHKVHEGVMGMPHTPPSKGNESGGVCVVDCDYVLESDHCRSQCHLLYLAFDCALRGKDAHVIEY